MSVILSGFILYLYIWACTHFFNFVLKYISSVSSDFFIQILPGWLLISLFSKTAMHIYPEFLHAAYLLDFIFYLASFISIFLIVMLLIKPFNKSLYDSVMKTIKKNRNID